MSQIRILGAVIAILGACASPAAAQTRVQADNVVVSDKPVADGLAIKGARSGISLDRLTITGDAVLTMASDASSLSNSTIQWVDATVKNGLTLRGDSHDVVVRQVRLRGLPAGDFPAGVKVQGTAHDLAFTDGETSGFRPADTAVRYPNGDGVSTEAGASRLAFDRWISNDNQDAGYDLKSASTIVSSSSAARNYRNVRAWAPVRFTAFTSDSPHGAHIWLDQGAAGSVFDGITFTGTGLQPLFEYSGARNITITVRGLDRAGVNPAAPLVLNTGKGKLTLTDKAP